MHPSRPADLKNGKHHGTGNMVRYKVVELSTVTDSDIESAVNAAVAEGWSYDGISFAMRDSSKRPSMAFVFFTKEISGAGGA